MSQPLVSVVIPTYNRARQVCVAIDSVLAQTWPSVEMVVVDDGSTDDTREVLKTRYPDDARIRYVFKTNGGPASARNEGFRHARGDYVALLDSDDTWLPWKLELQVLCMERDRSIGMTWTDMQELGPDGAVIDPAYLRHMYKAYRWFSDAQLFSDSVLLRDIAPHHASLLGDARLRTGVIFSQMIMGSLVHTSTVLLRRDRLEKVGGFNESLRYAGEDYDFHLRTAREGPVGLLDLPAIQYQQGMPDRLTAKPYEVFIAENVLRTLEPVLAHDRAAIHLPERMIRRKLADTHAWVAYEHLERGEADVALRHYVRSLRYWPWQPGIAKSVFFSALPFGSGVALRRRMQSLKHRFSGGPDPACSH